MNKLLRVMSVLVGATLLYYSMLLSNVGFNFSPSAELGDFAKHAVTLGWVLAISVTIVQFIVSTDFKELNSSLLIIGAFAYVYSIYTNYKGIVSFNADDNLAKVLAVIMDVAPELMIAWGLGQSRKGDLMGNLSKAGAFLWNKMGDDDDKSKKQSAHQKHPYPTKSTYKPKHKPDHLSKGGGDYKINDYADRKSVG